MLKYIPVILILLSAGYTIAQQNEFVCTPCGRDCDKNILNHGGTCGSCGMALVDKSTIGFKNLSIEEICQRITANPDLVLLDVRSPQEFDGSAGRMSYGHF